MYTHDFLKRDPHLVDDTACAVQESAEREEVDFRTVKPSQSTLQKRKAGSRKTREFTLYGFDPVKRK